MSLIDWLNCGMNESHIPLRYSSPLPSKGNWEMKARREANTNSPFHSANLWMKLRELIVWPHMPASFNCNQWQLIELNSRALSHLLLYIPLAFSGFIGAIASHPLFVAERIRTYEYCYNTSHFILNSHQLELNVFNSNWVWVGMVRRVHSIICLSFINQPLNSIWLHWI